MLITTGRNWRLNLINYTWGFNMSKNSRRIIAFIVAICCFTLPFHDFDIRFTKAPKLISDKEIESTNDRKKVKC